MAKNTTPLIAMSRIRDSLIRCDHNPQGEAMSRMKLLAWSASVIAASVAPAGADVRGEPTSSLRMRPAPRTGVLPAWLKRVAQASDQPAPAQPAPDQPAPDQPAPDQPAEPAPQPE